MNEMTPDGVIRRLLIIVRIIHVVFLITVPIAIIMVAILPRLSLFPVYESNESGLTSFEIISGGFLLLWLVVGFSWPWLAKCYKKDNRGLRDMLYGHLFRISFFETIVLVSPVLGLIGISWYILLPVLVLAGALLVLIFPNDRRLLEWGEKYN